MVLIMMLTMIVRNTLANAKGAAKKKALLRHFGDIDSLRKAGPEELRKIPGITAKIAEEILRHLNPVAPT